MKLLNLLGASALVLGLGACGGARDGTGTADLVLAGSLASTSLMSINSVGNPNYQLSSVDLSTLQMACLTLAIPPVAGTGAVAADGSFSVTLAGSSGKKIGCFVLDANDEPIATLVIADSSQNDLNGNAKTSTSTTLAGNVSLGAITLDLTAGTATVPLAQIVSTDTGASAVVVETAAALASAAWDTSGTWMISDYADKPSTYQDLCPAGTPHDGPTSCKGPEDGMTLYMQQVDGHKWVSGAATADVARGLMLWESAASYTACGSTVGTTFANLQTNAGVDFTGNTQGVNGTYFTLSDSVSCGGGTVTDGWKCSLATTQWETMPNCGPVAIDAGAKQGNMCTNLSKISVDLDGGCVDATTGAPVFIQDWHNVHWDTSSPVSNTTENHTVNGVSYPFHKNVNTVPYTNADHPSLTCTHIGYKEDGFVYPTPVAKDQPCATAVSGLEQARCYANYYWRNESHTGCIKRFDFDWSATTAGSFVRTDGKDEVKARFVADLYDLGADGVGILHTEKERMEGVPASSGTNTNWVNCRIREGTTLTFTPANAAHTESIVQLNEEQGLIDMDKAACLSYFVEQGAEKRTIGSTVIYVIKTNSMFTMTKQ